jgi:hypothetical protein
LSRVAFHDLPRSAFPFTVHAFPEDQPFDINPVWTRTVHDAGVVRIPGLEETGQRVRLVVYYADGTVDR